MLNKKNIKVVVITLLVLSVFVLNYFLIMNSLNKKNSWINLNKVYNEFLLTKDLDKKLKVVQNEGKKITDSLELQLKVFVKQFEVLSDNQKDQQSQIFELKRQEYLVKKQEFEDDNSQLQSDYNQQILTQINQYVKDYAIEKNYDFIFGAEGTGVLMYAKDGNEITEDVLKFINSKYKGENN